MKKIGADEIRNFLNGKYKYVIALAFAGILLIAFSDMDKPKVSERTEPAEEIQDDFIVKSEEKMRAIVESITGERDPRVLITAKTGVRREFVRQDEYSKNGTADEARQEYVVIKDSNGSQQVVPQVEEQPQVQGVVIVSAYAGTAAVKEKIIQAAMTAFDLPSNKVCVVQKNISGS